MSRLNNWKPSDWKGEKYKKREYASYSEYVHHQKDGMRHKGEKVIFGRFQQDLGRFTRNFSDLDFLKEKKCLCLGARSGAEVQALRDIGNKAIGVDLQPGFKNKLVEKGDFHNLRFEDNRFDVVYTNAFDHAFDLQKCLKEVKRVLKEDGIFILEMVAGYEEGGWPGDHEAAYWPKASDFCEVVESHGFKRIAPISDVPWCKGLPFKRALLKQE